MYEVSKLFVRKVENMVFNGQPRDQSTLGLTTIKNLTCGCKGGQIESCLVKEVSLDEREKRSGFKTHEQYPMS